MNPNRRNAVNWARYILDQDVLFLDTETTGVKSNAEIIDIGIIDKQGEVVYQSLIKPKYGIPVESIEIHGIDEQMVDDAPSWIEVYAHVVKATHKRPVIIYNKDFDLRMIRQECHRLQLPFVDAKDWHCAMLRFAEFVGERSHRGDFKWHKLEDAVKLMGLDLPPQTHRAIDDCLYTLHLVQSLSGVEVPAEAQRLF